MKRLFFVLSLAAVLTACGGGSSTDETGGDTSGINQGTGADTSMNNMGDTSMMDTSGRDTSGDTGRR